MNKVSYLLFLAVAIPNCKPQKLGRQIIQNF